MTGETEWTKTGRWTGTTELELTDKGVEQVLATGRMLIGTGKLIDPARLAHVFVSPRQRAQTTFDLLFDDVGKDALEKDGKVSTTEELAEWDYGKYEGLLTKEIRARREGQGLDQERPWDIWRDGCEDGEWAETFQHSYTELALILWRRSAEQVTDRLDGLIRKIYEIQCPCMYGENPADVVLVSDFRLRPLPINSSSFGLAGS